MRKTQINVSKETLKSPDISVIVPVYNNEEYIKRCIQSILNQSHSNIEIIAVDDYSTDRSRIILENLALNDQRLKVIHNEKNLGTGRTRNLAIDMSTAAYIMFVDSDDWINTDACEVLFKTCKSNRLDILEAG